jgi:pyruvate dehydrogenase E1 component alpha subunit
LADHTTADDASRYRDDEEVSTAWHRDPLARVKTYLSEQKLWTREDEEALLRRCNDRVDTAAETYLATPPQAPEAIFDYLYATLPRELVAQREALLKGVGDG